MKKIPLLLIIIFLIGMIGTVMFFPIKMNSGATCMSEKMCNKKCDDCPKKLNKHNHNHHLVTHYIVPYGIIWWLCIAVLTLSLYYFFKSNSKFTDKD